MYAAGMTKPENYPAFKEAFEKASKDTIPENLRVPEIEIDAEINFYRYYPKLIRILKQFEPLDH
jgi:single-stranded-DNA-specific exonuclease